jgi:hypothetical protein
MLKKDNIILGVLIGLALPGLFFGLLSIASMWIATGSVWARPFESDKMLLLSVFINLIPIRLYFVSWKLDKTGRGVLISMFILVIAYFIFIKYF